MTHPEFDRHQLRILPLAERTNKLQIERDHVAPTAQPGVLSDATAAIVTETVGRIRMRLFRRLAVYLLIKSTYGEVGS